VGEFPSNAAVEQYMGDVPHYAAAQRELAAAYEWAVAGFPGATLEQIITIATNLGSERQATDIRERAENQCKSMLGLPTRKPRRPSMSSYFRKGLRKVSAEVRS
jgi:hypothetical protein